MIRKDEQKKLKKLKKINSDLVFASSQEKNLVKKETFLLNASSLNSRDRDIKVSMRKQRDNKF